MKNKIYILVAGLLLSFTLSAQRGNNQFIFGIEAGFPSGSGLSAYNTGIGVFGKALMGIGDKSQLGFGTGYTVFKFEDETANFKHKRSVVPIMAIYRQQFNILYFEPQLGYGIYSSTFKTESGGNSVKTTSSDGGFTFAIGGGVQISALDLGVRYQAGFPEGSNFSFFGIHAGYTFRARR